MGHKVVCLDCRRSFSQGNDFNNRKETLCPKCRKPMTLLPHRFRPPKKTEDEKWRAVRYLIENGFYYQHIYATVVTRKQNYIEYPENLRDAKEFVKKYKAQAIKGNITVND